MTAGPWYRLVYVLQAAVIAVLLLWALTDLVLGHYAWAALEYGFAALNLYFVPERRGQ